VFFRCFLPNIKEVAETSAKNVLQIGHWSPSKLQEKFINLPTRQLF
jgi:hypothetical protein